MDFISDLQRSFMPLPEAFLREIRSEDRFLLAFPRSGSRWMVRLLTDLANAAFGLAPSPCHELYLKGQPEGCEGIPGSGSEERQSTIPDAHGQAYGTSALIPLGKIPIFRAHHLREVVTRSTGPIVYIVRQAVPTLFSYYHFARNRKIVPEGLSLDDFCEGKLPQWKDHVSTMLAVHQASPGRVLLVTYRDSGPFLRSQIEAAASHLGIPWDAETTDAALTRMSDFLQALNTLPTTVHPRGANRAIYEEFPLELTHWIEAETGGLYQEVLFAEESGGLRSA